MLSASAGAALARRLRVFCRPADRRRGAAARRHSCRRHRQQRQLRRGQHRCLDRRAGSRSAFSHTGAGPNLAAARAPAIVARNGAARRRRAAQLGVLADRPRGRRGRFARHRGDPRPHRLSGADWPARPGMPPPNRPGVPPLIVTWADAGYLAEFQQGHRGAAAASRHRRRLLPLGARTRAAAIHDGHRARRHRRRRRHRDGPWAALSRCRSKSIRAGRSSTAWAISRSRPAISAASIPAGSACWST